MSNFISELGVIIYATLIYTPALLYAALGSCFSEVSGVINIGIEGMMTVGAFTGAAVAYFTSSPMLGFLCAGIAGMIFGALHASATVLLNADQTISGTAINMIGPGLAILVARALFDSTDTIPLSPEQKMPLLFRGIFDTSTTFGKFMENVFGTYVSTYLVFVLVVVVWFIFYKTKFGLRLRSCGEHPEACETLGINQGFIAIAAVIFGKFRPQGALIGCLLFGFCSGLKVVLGGSGAINMQIISMIPYVVTVIVLILFVGKSHVPTANGKPFIKSR
ncbi:MAG: ABC transporter permease [Clostridia bacterium]|nr:ABC transporter permease [Clostridia bacterium]